MKKSKIILFTIFCFLLSLTTVSAMETGHIFQARVRVGGSYTTPFDSRWCTDRNFPGTLVDARGSYAQARNGAGVIGLPDGYSGYFCQGTSKNLQNSAITMSKFEIRETPQSNVVDFLGFCLDPMRPGPGEIAPGAWVDYEVRRALLDSTNKVLEYDRALYSIWKYGYVERNLIVCDANTETCRSNSTDADRSIAQIAARLLTYHFGYGDEGYLAPANLSQYNGYPTYKITAANLSYRFTNKAGYNNDLSGYLLKPTIDIVKSAQTGEWWGMYPGNRYGWGNGHYLPLEGRGLIFENEGVNQGNASMQELVRLYKQALEDSKKTEINKELVLSSDNFPLEQTGLTGVTQVSGDTYQFTATVKVTQINKFIHANKGGYFKNVVIGFDEKSAALTSNLRLSYVWKDKTEAETKSQNYAALSEDPEFVVTITGKREDLTKALAGEIHLAITSDFFDLYDAKNTAVGWIANGKHASSYQRLVAFREKKTEKEGDKYKAVILLKADCIQLQTDMEEVCKLDKNSDECKNATENYYETCETCVELNDRKNTACRNPDSKECTELTEKYEKECMVCFEEDKRSGEKSIEGELEKCEKQKEDKEKDSTADYDVEYCERMEDLWKEKKCDEKGLCNIDGGAASDADDFGKKCCEELEEWLKKNNASDARYPAFKKAWDVNCDNRCVSVTIGYERNYCESRDESLKEIKIEEPEDYKTCIVGTDNSTESAAGVKGAEWEDDAGNSRTIKELKNNYCNVACKEDYKFTLPQYLGSIKSGTYFEFEGAKIEGTRTCVTSDINHKQFNEDYERLRKETIDAYNSYIYAYEASLGNWTYEQICRSEASSSGESCSSDANGVESCSSWYCSGGSACATASEGSWTYPVYDYNGNHVMEDGSDSGGSVSCGCSGCSARNGPTASDYAARARTLKDTFDAKLAEFQKAIADMQNCSNWSLNIDDGKTYQYLFEPEIEFIYEESYYMGMMDTAFSGSEGSTKLRRSEGNTKYNYEYCLSGVDSSYTCRANDLKTTLASVSEKTFLRFDCTGACRTLNSNNEIIKDTVNIMTTVEKAAAYTPSTHFITQHPTGIVVKKGDEVAGVNYTDMEYVFPVMLTTQAGEYNYVLRFNNVGQYYDDMSQLGRIFNTDSRISTMEVLKDRSPVSFHDGKIHMADFACKYGVEADAFNKCISVGLTGIGDKGETTFTYRPISLNDVFPNARGGATGKELTGDTREPGSNWTTAKAEETQLRIEGAGDAAYRDAQYSYTLNTTQMGNLRAHNRQKENEGTGYDDFDLVCDNGIDCTSNLLDDDSGTYFTEHARNTHFEHWDGSNGLGPSWY